MVQLQKLSGETDDTKRQWQIVNRLLSWASSVGKSPKVGDESNYARARYLSLIRHPLFPAQGASIRRRHSEDRTSFPLTSLTGCSLAAGTNNTWQIS